MSGPTNANSLALFAMLAPLAAAGSAAYIELVLVTTLLVGVLQFGVGVLRLGGIANFISPATLKGFTAGGAVLIAVHALKDVLGLDVRGAHPDALGVLRLATTEAAAWSGPAIAVAAVAAGVALAVPALAPR